MIEIEIPPRSVYVGVVRLALGSLARASGLDEETVDDLKIAISEACANAVLAQEAAGSDAPVRITWSDDDEPGIVIEVHDPQTQVHDTPQEDQDSQGISTRLTMSVALLQSLVDTCEFRPGLEGGMVTRMVINR
jgi:serine/threonine-protein kinase RsbW